MKMLDGIYRCLLIGVLAAFAYAHWLHAENGRYSLNRTGNDVAIVDSRTGAMYMVNPYATPSNIVRFDMVQRSIAQFSMDRK